MTRNGAVNNQLTFEEGGGGGESGQGLGVTVNLLICDRRGSLFDLVHSLLPSTTYVLAVQAMCYRVI